MNNENDDDDDDDDDNRIIVSAPKENAQHTLQNQETRMLDKLKGRQYFYMPTVFVE